MMTDENRLGEWNDVTCDKQNGFICQQLPSKYAKKFEVIFNNKNVWLRLSFEQKCSIQEWESRCQEAIIR